MLPNLHQRCYFDERQSDLVPIIHLEDDGLAIYRCGGEMPGFVKSGEIRGPILAGTLQRYSGYRGTVQGLSE